MQEYVAADFRHKGKILNKKKKQKKSIYDANNARNRDSYSVTKANGMNKPLDKVSPMQNRSTNLGETEDVLIAVLDDFNKSKA